MANHKPLYIWWIITLIMATLAFWLGYNGTLEHIYVSDITHLTQLMAFLLIIGNLRIGWLAWKFSKNDYSLPKIRKHVDEWWFVSEQLMGLGILGTVCGLIFLFYSTFSGLPTDITSEVISEILPKIIGPMGTIFYTTAVGLATSLFLKIQLLLFTSYSGIDDDRYAI